MPSPDHVSVKLSKPLLSQLSPLRYPGESWNHFLERLLPDIRVAAQKELRRLAGRRSRKTAPVDGNAG